MLRVTRMGWRSKGRVNSSQVFIRKEQVHGHGSLSHLTGVQAASTAQSPLTSSNAIHSPSHSSPSVSCGAAGAGNGPLSSSSHTADKIPTDYFERNQNVISEQKNLNKSNNLKSPNMSAPQFLDFPAELKFAAMEEELLAYWTKIDAFQTSLKKSEGRPHYTFFDGPPFATGLPHYGHLLAGTIKDVVCRFAHQTGHHVERRFGWDCHGLPIEFEIEKELGIKSSQDVKAFGIANYNAECRKIVMRYADEWDKIITRCGRWIDFKNDYKTMNINFMESVWWAFAELWKKDLVYRGFKVMPYSTACTTPLSNFESNMNYKEVSDPSAIVSFPLVEDPSVAFLAWTTTPWTLPSNVALTVNPEFEYVTVEEKKTQKKYIFAACRLNDLYKGSEKLDDEKKPYVVLSRCKGSDLAGKKYTPLFDYFAKESDQFFRVVADGYVTSDAGTGVVHCAPGFGEEDCRVALANGVIVKGQTVCPVEENGLYTDEVTDFAGRYVKDCDNDILAMLKDKGRLFQKAAIVHSYPFCWRSETPLIYRAIDAWFVRVEDIRDKLLAANSETNWVPDFVKTRRFSNWLEDAKDWNVSRNRYWGTPLPVWHSEDWEEIVCVGSVKELEELSGVTGITDIHREFVDKITIPSKRPGMPPLKRIEQVFDCWFESGSMPYGQAHYPFENKEHFEKNFPADFIAEGLDQTRGWFYTLLVLSTALFGRPPYKNLIVNGLVLASDGKKMSKRLKNYPDVIDIVNTYGADALRLYLINSPVVRAEPLRFREDGVKDIVKDVFLPFFNACKFFIGNANLYIADGKALDLYHKSGNDMDRWILSASRTLVNYVHREMKGYRLYTVVPGLLRFVEELTNWYVRMNRRRLKGQAGEQDHKDSLCTLFNVMFNVSRILAPFCPYVAEGFYQRLRPVLPEEIRVEESVHYLMVPEVTEKTEDEVRLEATMARMIKIIDLVRVLRDRIGIPMKMPVRSVIVLHPDAEYINDVKATTDYITSEVNTFDLQFSSEESTYVITKLDANMATVGKKFRKESAEIKKTLAAATPEMIAEFLTKGALTVCGQDLEAEDVRVLRTFRPDIQDYESNADGRVVVLVDKRKDEGLMDAWRAREFTNRVMQLRKTAGLLVTDKVNIYYSTADATLANSLVVRADQINETVRDAWTTKDAMAADAVVVAKVDATIDDTAIEIVFTKTA